MRLGVRHGVAGLSMQGSPSDPSSIAKKYRDKMGPLKQYGTADRPIPVLVNEFKISCRVPLRVIYS